MWASRARVASMFSRISPSTRSYQVATEWGEPSGRIVPTTAGFGLRRNSSISGGSGGRGIVRPYASTGRRRSSLRTSGTASTARVTRIAIAAAPQSVARTPNASAAGPASA